MPDLDIRITSMYPPGATGGIRAYASATIDGCFGVRGIKVVEGGKDGLFVAMPSRKTQDGYKDICFPVTAEFRSQLYSAVLDTYHQQHRYDALDLRRSYTVLFWTPTIRPLPWRRRHQHPRQRPHSRNRRRPDRRCPGCKHTKMKQYGGIENDEDEKYDDEDPHYGYR